MIVSSGLVAMFRFGFWCNASWLFRLWDDGVFCVQLQLCRFGFIWMTHKVITSARNVHIKEIYGDGAVSSTAKCSNHKRHSSTSAQKQNKHSISIFIYSNDYFWCNATDQSTCHCVLHRMVCTAQFFRSASVNGSTLISNGKFQYKCHNKSVCIVTQLCDDLFTIVAFDWAFFFYLLPQLFLFRRKKKIFATHLKHNTDEWLTQRNSLAVFFLLIKIHLIRNIISGFFFGLFVACDSVCYLHARIFGRKKKSPPIKSNKLKWWTQRWDADCLYSLCIIFSLKCIRC